jgi:hypothetical protein
MKTTIEIKNHVIEIEETDDSIIVTATKDGETVEEFTLESGEETEEGDEDDDFGTEEGDEELPDEDGDETPEEGEEPIEGEEEEDFSANESVKVHSFGSFQASLKKQNKRK